MRVIGTAGHVDHGKSTLVRALTGIDPDRLKEEKQRQMTIDLGFAWYESSSLGPIGIVDVPGHRDFIENMLSGVGGIDAVLLVIAADEGVMPQTREHLAIIDLLKINHGLVVLTKTDLVVDSDWIDLVEVDIKEVLKGTILENAPILRVSAVTSEGISELKIAIDNLLLELGPRVDLGRARLPIDRVFTVTGFGTVVTGTLIGGSFSLDDQVELLPSQKKARVRGLQTHKKQESKILPGTRTAINLSGLDVSEVNRGDTIVHTGQFSTTMRIDAWLEILADSPTVVKHNDKVKLFLATTETVGRIRLLEGPSLEPGRTGWVQIETEKGIVTAKDDRFIIRRLSPAQTIGGGVVLDPHPSGRYKLNDELVVSKLEARASNTTRDKVMAMINESPFISANELHIRLQEENVNITEILDSLVASEEIKRVKDESLSDPRFIEMNFWRRLTLKAIEALQSFHAANPLRRGMVLGELARRIRVTVSSLSMFIQAWKDENLIYLTDDIVSLAVFNIKYSANQQKRIREFLMTCEKDPFNPPNVKDAMALLTDDVYQSMLEQVELVQVSPEVVFRSSEYRLMLDYVVSECFKGVLLTLAQFRDHFSTSRKYAQAFLEYLDRKGVTIREGDGRKLK